MCIKRNFCYGCLLVIFSISVACESQSENSKRVNQMQVEKGTAEMQIAPIALIDIPLDDTEGAPALTRNFYFIFDGSGSMNDEDCGERFETRVDGAKWAVKEFLQGIPNDVNIGLYLFDSGGTREVPWSRLRGIQIH